MGKAQEKYEAAIRYLTPMFVVCTRCDGSGAGFFKGKLIACPDCGHLTDEQREDARIWRRYEAETRDNPPTVTNKLDLTVAEVGTFRRYRAQYGDRYPDEILFWWIENARYEPKDDPVVQKRAKRLHELRLEMEQEGAIESGRVKRKALPPVVIEKDEK